MTSLFWGLRLEPGKRYSTTVDKAFHVSMAALDCASVKSDGEVLSVMLEESESAVPFILCNLNKGKVMQASLDLNFMTGDRVTFFCKGNGVVHLSGYIVADDDEYGHLEDEEEDEDEDEEEEDEEDSMLDNSNMKLGKKNKMAALNGLPGAAKRVLEDATNKKNKKKKLEQMSEEDDSDEDEEEDDLDMLDEMEGDSDLEEEEDSDVDEDDGEDDDEEEEEQEPKPSPPTSSKKDKKKPQSQQATPNLNKQQQQANKQKTPNGITPQQQSGKKDKKNKGETPGNDTPKGGKAKDEGTPGKKTLDGGVSVKDIRVGQGAVCKNGKMATVYYTGRLKSNHKVFDSVLQGAGFKFRVGRGEVIKGWDVGVNGMKVGGKRFITCPPQMAYGAKGVAPSIPPNSTLLFEVELINVQ